MPFVAGGAGSGRPFLMLFVVVTPVVVWTCCGCKCGKHFILGNLLLGNVLLKLRHHFIVEQCLTINKMTVGSIPIWENNYI